MDKNSEVLTYGVIEQNESHAPADIYVEEIRCKGYTIIPGVFSAKDMREASLLIDSLYEQQTRDCGGIEALRRARDEDLLRCPLIYHDHFLSLATHEFIHAVIACLLGKNYVLMMQNAIINRPVHDQYQARWHRDLNYQHWTSSRPLSVNFLVAVDEFFQEGGSTWVLPGSHHYETFPSDDFVRKHQTCLEAVSGSVIVMNSMIYHRAGINRRTGYTRRAINHVVGLPFMGQQIDIPSMLGKHGKDYGKDTFLAGYLGYRWNPAFDVETWREKHASSADKP